MLHAYSLWAGPGDGALVMVSPTAGRFWVPAPPAFPDEPPAEPPELELLDDADLATALLDVAVLQGEDARIGRIIDGILDGLYLADHGRRRLVWVDLRSPEVWQYNHARPLRYRALAVFLMRERALDCRCTRHMGTVTDPVGLSITHWFHDEPTLVERARSFRVRRARYLFRAPSQPPQVGDDDGTDILDET